MKSKGRNKDASEKALKLCNYQCVVCGWSKRRSNGSSLVEGAHIRPFESGSEFDKADNIIALCPNHHTEYDAHNFYIDTQTRRLVFKDESDEYNGVDISSRIMHIRTENLAYAQYQFERER